MIRIMSQLEYDNGKAFSWAKEHNLALNTTLNKKAFEKFVKAEPTKFEFVTLVETPSATIPTKIEIENTLESGENIK